MKILIYSLLLLFCFAFLVSFQEGKGKNSYEQLYLNRIGKLELELQRVIKEAEKQNLSGHELKNEVLSLRKQMKRADFWFRYLEPLLQKRINGPLPVEWETEVFEKFEKPYRREGSGLTLVWEQVEADTPDLVQIRYQLESGLMATRAYYQDSIFGRLAYPDHLLFANRLFLLNLSAIYTTGFECPSPQAIIPELKELLLGMPEIYSSFNESYPEKRIPESYLQLFREMIDFVANQPWDYQSFDHYRFIREYVNPLFAMNQELIRNRKAVSRSLVDYSLSKKSVTLFGSGLYLAQQPSGIFHRVKDSLVLAEMKEIGRMLFFDPVLSGNGKRSCASCHKPEQYFTDTTLATSLNYDGVTYLQRNTPTLLHAADNHLIMADGRHLTLTDQVAGVVSSPDEMGLDYGKITGRVMSISTYKKALKRWLVFTPEEPEVTVKHIASLITLYYGSIPTSEALFDQAMNRKTELTPAQRNGFNLFMGKAACGTCHFVPWFNGVKPPYVGSEFEVIGVPSDTNFSSLSPDSGRYKVNPAPETLHAIRTGSLRNIANTAPYMHNGVFGSLKEVIEFYNNGGGAGRNLPVFNQTLSADSLFLSAEEKENLFDFMCTLTEKYNPDSAPVSLPASSDKSLNKRKPGGEY